MTAIEQPPASLPHPHAAASPFSRDVGAVVLGGDYQGLGIVRSIGRQGVPVCVVDDERSIARLSRHCGFHEPIADLGDEERVVDDLLGIARRRGLEGWVLFPTRDETVAAIARNRDRLSEVFRVPTPPWDAVRWAWDKRNTASIAEQVGRPRAAQLAARHRWRSSTRSTPSRRGRSSPRSRSTSSTPRRRRRGAPTPTPSCASCSSGPGRIAGQGQMIVQELIPGDGRQQFAYCALYATRPAARDHGRAPPPPAPAGLRPREHVRRDGRRAARSRRSPSASCAGSATTGSSSSSTSAIRATAASSSSTSTPAPGATTRSPRRPAWTSRTSRTGTRSGCRSSRSARTPGVRWVRLLTDLPTGFVQIRAGDFTRPRVPAHAAQRARGGRVQPRGSASRPRRGRAAALSRRQTGVLGTCSCQCSPAACWRSASPFRSPGSGSSASAASHSPSAPWRSPPRASWPRSTARSSRQASCARCSSPASPSPPRSRSSPTASIAIPSAPRP